MTKTTKTDRPKSALAPEAVASDAAAGRPQKGPTKLESLEDLLSGPQGASLQELKAATGWQTHSIRGAMAGALKKRGLVIVSDKTDGVRRYRASRA